MPRLSSYFCTIVALFAGFLPGLTLAQEGAPVAADGYRRPPKNILDILDAPAPPFARVAANQKWLVVTEREIDHVSIAELAEPMLLLAGTRFKQYPNNLIENVGITRIRLTSIDGATERVIVPPEGGRIAGMDWVRNSTTGGELAYSVIHQGAMAIHLYDASNGVDRLVAAPGLTGKIADLNFTMDGRYLAFTAATRAEVVLWLVDTRTAQAGKVEGVSLNHVLGGISWTQGRPPLIARALVPDRGPPPAPSEIPTGPIVQESLGRTAQGRTFQDLLKSRHDEALFDYYFTNQIISVDETGKATRLGTPGIHIGVSPSPNGEFLLVNTLHRPYSYQVSMNFFPRRTEVWTRAGELLKLVNDSPLRENLPSQRDAVLPGIRSIFWRSDVPATVVMLEALDDGDPKKDLPKRDRVSLLTAPFTEPPVMFAETEMRFAGIVWAFPDLALLTERSARTARTRTWLINPSKSAEPPRLVWDRSSEDRYSDPGTLVLTEHPTELRQIPLRSGDGRWVYLRGNGESQEGARPFLDRLDVVALKTERLWQSSPPHFESPVELLDSEARRIIFSRESPTLRPNLYLRDLAGSETRQLTDLPDPAPWFAEVKSDLIRYRRDDGTQLSATLYLPPGYDKQRDGRLPFFFWAYPREFLTEAGASQVTGSPLQFKRPALQDHLLLLAQGYGILDNPTMPIVGKGDQEPNDQYVEQLVASAKAAVDYLVELGVADRQRIGIGGHSYGAFMTANLLAHSNLFRAGIARSGAYNRTLTPFGFQAEPRTYWQAAEVYHRMSPFTHAPAIDEPILLIHGMRDSNQGTFPIQSERMFAAIKGAGGNVRYVQLPLEDHGYTARESRQHVLWEMITWLDKFVKQPSSSAQTQ